jgi:hypothetical protein
VWLTGTLSRVSTCKDHQGLQARLIDAAFGEAYAQAAVLLAFDINQSGPLDDIVDWDCASGVYNKLKEQLGALLKYDESATCKDRFPKSLDVCVQDDGEVLYCEDNVDSDDSTDSTDSTNNNDDDGNDNDNDNGNSNNGTDTSNNGDGESGASRPNVLAVFRLVAQVLRATGLLHGQ